VKPVRHICVLDSRPHVFALANGIIRLYPGANAVEGDIKASYDELVKDGHFQKYLDGGLFVIAETEKDIPWDKFPQEVRAERNREEALKKEEAENKRIQARGLREFRKDIEAINAEGRG